MSRLRPEKLHVTFGSRVGPAGPIAQRRYTLTHSDSTGDLFLTVAEAYDQKQISGWYTRFMRDEVLAEWKAGENPSLHVYCHVSGGLVLGPAGWRYQIFQRELPLVLEAFRYGDAALFDAHPALDQAPIWVHYRATQRRYQKSELWGVPADYQQTPA